MVAPSTTPMVPAIRLARVILNVRAVMDSAILWVCAYAILDGPVPIVMIPSVQSVAAITAYPSLMEYTVNVSVRPIQLVINAKQINVLI